MDSLSVVIPARNEAGNVGRLVTELRASWPWDGELVEIIVVDDHSTDNTANEALEAGAIVVMNVGHPGYGNAVKAGLEAALNTWVTIMVADGSDRPEDLWKMFRMNHDDVDAIFGHRFIAGSQVTGYPTVKCIANRLGNRLAALALYTSYTDLTNPFKIFRTSVVRDYLPRLTATDFSLGFELTARFMQDTRPFLVIPTTWRDRTVGTSKFQMKHALGFLRTLFYVVRTHAPLL